MKPRFLKHRIKEIRKGPPKLATQNEMADALGIDQSTYQRKESGPYPITVDELLVIADRFGVDVTQFFDNISKQKNEGGESEGSMRHEDLVFYQKMVDQLKDELARCYEKLARYEGNERPFHKTPKKNGGG